MKTYSKSNRLKWIALALLVGMGSPGCSSSNSPSTPQVRVAKPVRGDVVASFVASGRVQAKVVKLAPGEHGRLLAIKVKLGQEVRKGQPLAQLDDADERAQLRSMEADLQAAVHRRSEAAASLSAKRSQIQNDLARAQAGRGEAYSHYQDVARGDRSDVDSARANLEGARSRYVLAQKELARQKEMFKDDIVSTAALEKVQSQLTQAAANRDQAQAQLVKAQSSPRKETVSVASSQVRKADVDVSAAQNSGGDLGVLEERVQTAEANVQKVESEMEEAKLGLKRTDVRSPADGIVSSIFLEPGEMVGIDVPILAIQKTDHIWIEAEIDEQDSSQVKLDQPVDITFTTQPGKTYPGKIEEIAPTLEQRANSPGDSKVLKIRVGFKDKVPDLRAGLHADVQGHSSGSVNVLKVPSSAIVNQAGQNYVWTVTKGALQKLPVVVGERTSDQTAIRQGLQDDTEVVVEGADGLAEGAAVKVRQ